MWFVMNQALNRTFSQRFSIPHYEDILTLFDYNKEKQPLKHKTSCAQLEVGNKKQLCEEAFNNMVDGKILKSK